MPSGGASLLCFVANGGSISPPCGRYIARFVCLIQPPALVLSSAGVGRKAIGKGELRVQTRKTNKNKMLARNVKMVSNLIAGLGEVIEAREQEQEREEAFKRRLNSISLGNGINNAKNRVVGSRTATVASGSNNSGFP